MVHFSFIFLSLFVSCVSAANDWSKPCLSGICQYDIPSSSGGASGTLLIWGSEAAISDITPAAGWQILDCSPDSLQQNIRLVCQDSNSTSCAHLYSGTTDSNNAVGKVVRLPENCGKNAFAVVTKVYVPQNQTIPPTVAATIHRRDGTQPVVQGLQIDTSFASTPPTSAGPVNFAIRAANVPGANGNLTISPQQQRRSNSRFFGRGLGSFISSALDDISSLDGFNVNKSTTLTPVDVDKSFNLVDQSISCGPIDASLKVDVDAKAHAVASIGVAVDGTILPPKINDFSIIAGLTASIDGTIEMQATASGSFDSGTVKLFEVGIPGLDFPGILTIGPSFIINGQATASLELDADMTVGISYEIDNAQLVFPPNSKQSGGGSFNIGDTPLKLSVSPSAKASGTVDAHLIPTLNFGISALDDSVSANIFLALDASASMTLSAQAQGNVDASVITASSQKRDAILVGRMPQSADVDSSNDTSAISVEDSDTNSIEEGSDSNINDSSDIGDGTTGIDGSTGSSGIVADSSDTSVDGEATDDGTGIDSNAFGSDEISTTDSSSDNTSSDETNGQANESVAVAGSGSGSPSSPLVPNDDNTNTVASFVTKAPSSTTLPKNTTTSSSFGGCFEIDSALNVNAGASGDFFGLFDKSTKVDLFNKKFQILKKCFGNASNASATRRSSTIQRRRIGRVLPPSIADAFSSVAKRDGLTCPAAADTSSSSPESIADQTIPSKDITAQ